MYIGVDFGTTNSAVAVYDGEQLHTLVVDPTNIEPQVMPSLIYINREGQQIVGASAAQIYLDAETGRQVQWQQWEVGEFEHTIASFEYDPVTYLQVLKILVDVAANGRLLQSIKRALFNARYEGTHIFGKFYRIEHLISIILTKLRIAAEKQLGISCQRIVLGRPVQFSDNPVADYRAESILMKAAHLAGFSDVVLEFEPVGVAHLYHRESREHQTVLVFDFGGGTLDLTIARVGGGTPPEILATTGVLVGGDDLDRRLMEFLLPYFGGGDEGRLPPQIIDKLLSWQTMPELSQPMYVEQIRELQRASDDPAPYHALESLVSNNLGFQLFKEIERVKRVLSTEPSAVLQFDHEDIHIYQPITRRRFERLIAREINDVEIGIQRVLATANLSAHEIDVVLRTGGTSLVPAFYDLLVSFFGQAKQRAIDPMVSVVGGFAVRGHHLEFTRKTYVLEAVIGEVSNRGSYTYRIGRTQIGGKCYTDRDFVFGRIPSVLNDLPMIQTPNLDHKSTENDLFGFLLRMPARVYIAYDTAAERIPHWLQEFNPEPIQIEIEDEFALIVRTMRIYSREYPAGMVRLGGNRAAGYQDDGGGTLNYLVIVKPLN